MNKNNAYFDAAGKEDLFMGRYYILTKSISDQAKEDALNELRARGNVKVAEITEDGKYLLVETEDGEYSEVMSAAVNIFNRVANGCEMRFSHFAAE